MFWGQENTQDTWLPLSQQAGLGNLFSLLPGVWASFFLLETALYPCSLYTIGCKAALSFFFCYDLALVSLPNIQVLSVVASDVNGIPLNSILIYFPFKLKRGLATLKWEPPSLSRDLLLSVGK